MPQKEITIASLESENMSSGKWPITMNIFWKP
jgi:hypothetical protein